MNNKKRVVVTGYGAVSSMGNNADEIWKNLMNYEVGYNYFDFSEHDIHSKFYGFFDLDKSLLKGISKKLLKQSPMFAKYSLIAAREAIEMSLNGMTLDEIADDFERGTIIGTGYGGIDSIVENSNHWFAEGYASSFSNVMTMKSIATAVVSMNWNLRGMQSSPVAACATGSIAIGEAYEAIKAGRAKYMVAGGTESIKHNYSLWTIDSIQALNKSQEAQNLASCPFDSNRSGFVLSEGAAVLCLEDYDNAKARGATILAEIVGYANYSDCHDMTAPAEDLLARVNVIKDLCKQGGTLPDYVNLHGTSTPLNDKNETAAFKAALGNVAYEIPMSSTKSYTGHLIAAAGSIETIFCIKGMHDNVIPATRNLHNPDPECDLNYVPNEHMTSHNYDLAMNISFGFGGTNAGLMVKKYVD